MRKIVAVLSVIILFAAVFCVPACADSATIALSKSNVTIGANVTVTLTYNSTYAMYAVDGTLTYNSSVLQYVSGGTNKGSSVKIVEALSGETTMRTKIVFKAIAAGSGSLAFSCKASGGGDGSASAGATVNVTAVQPSTNANLGSISLSEGTLSPEFSANKTDYTASVAYSVEKITIKANAAVGDSTVAGVGTFDLKMGDNKRSITVTAASGAKKTYSITVRRMTEEETAAAIQAERDNNPYLFVSDGKDYYIQPDLSSVTAFEGYSVASAERKGSAISVLSDAAGRYKLYYALDENGENGAFFTSNDSDVFTKLNYITVGNNIYILEPFQSDISVSSQFTADKYDLNGVSVDCYKYSGEDNAGFYIFFCYANGESGYYRYDSVQKTMQREPTFIAAEPVLSEDVNGTLIDKFNNLSMQAKIVLALLALAALLVLVLIILLIVRAAKGSGEEEDIEEETAEAIDFNAVIPDDSMITDIVPETPVSASVEEDDEDDSIDDSEFLDLEDN